MAEMEAEEASNVSSRQLEREKLNSILTPLGLAIRDITPDGHCLYAAVSDQLSVHMKIKVGGLLDKCNALWGEPELNVMHVPF